MKIIEQLRNPNFRFIKLRPNTKIPFEKGWQKDANYTCEEISYYKDNIGIVAGFGNLRILDLDVKDAQGFNKISRKRDNLHLTV